jgi:hypothetical protein
MLQNPPSGLGGGFLCLWLGPRSAPNSEYKSAWAARGGYVAGQRTGLFRMAGFAMLDSRNRQRAHGLRSYWERQGAV